MKKLKTGIYTTTKNGRINVHTTKPLTRFQRILIHLQELCNAAANVKTM